LGVGGGEGEEGGGGLDCQKKQTKLFCDRKKHNF
jgi:hypothetical protein